MAEETYYWFTDEGDEGCNETPYFGDETLADVDEFVG